MSDVTSGSRTSPLSGKKVLIVEDDSFLGGIILRYLEKIEVSALQAKSGEEALELIKKDPPDVVTLDIFLPGMNGLQMLETLRNDPATATLPVLVVSNTGELKYRTRAKELNAVFFVKAVVTPDIIISEMEKMVSKATN